MNNIKNIVTALYMLIICCPIMAQQVEDVYREFKKVPDSTRTKVWWFHGENITTREGITADLEAYKAQGVGGVVYYDQQHGPGTKDALLSMSPEWWEMLKFSAQEAKRLGLSFEINISNGYVCGGLWITPELGMKAVYSQETWIKSGEHFQGELPSPGRQGEKDIAVLAFPAKKGYHETIKCINQGFAVKKNSVIHLVSFDQPFTARSLSYHSTGYSKGAQSIVNVPCEPQDDFCGDSFTLLADLGELEVSNDSIEWHTVCTLPPCYRMQSLRPNFTISFPATTGRYFRLNLHDWDTKGRELTIKNVELSSKAVTYRWEERAAYASEYIRPTRTPNYQGHEVVSQDDILDLTGLLDAQGHLDWKAPTGTDWKVIRFVYAPTGAKTKHGRKNLMGLECDKLSDKTAEYHWNNYAQRILDTLAVIDCRPSGVCMDSHEAGQQNWADDFAELFHEQRGYDIRKYLPAMQGYIINSVDETERFLSDLRRTIADGISNRYYVTLQQMADKAGVHFTAQATGNGQSICSDNLMAKGKVDRPQGEFWTRMHDGSYDIKEAACAVHIYGGNVASAEAFTDFCYTNYLGNSKDQIDMATAFQVNELVVCASEFQPWVHSPQAGNQSVLKINTGFNRDYALNRINTQWPFSNGFWDYQARNSFIMRQGKPVVDILVYAGDEAPMKLLAHRLPFIPEGYDFDVCSTDALHSQLSLKDKQLVSHGNVCYQILAIEKTAVVRQETEKLINEWKSKGLAVYDNRTMGDHAMTEILEKANIHPDIRIKSKKTATDRVFFTHRQTDDADYYFIVNHSKLHTFCDDIFLRTKYNQAEWWSAIDGSRKSIMAIHTDKGLKLSLRLNPDEAGFIVVHNGKPSGLKVYNAHPKEHIEAIKGAWTVTFDTTLGGPENPVVFDQLTDWTQSNQPNIRYFSGKAVYEKTVEWEKPKKGECVKLRIPGLKGVSRVLINGKEAGLVWCTPWEVDITSLIRRGKNRVSIEVRNSLANRLIGDASLPENQRHTWIYTPLYSEKDNLVPSGIVGDVQIVKVIE